MRQRMRGFTIVELIVVIVIIGILSTFITVQLIHSQLAARDQVRANDVKIIASNFETVYQSGQIDGTPIPTGDALVSDGVAMGYPSTALMNPPVGDVQAPAIIGAINPSVLKSPSNQAMSLVGALTNAGVSGLTVGGITLGATAANDRYVYQPLTTTNTLCTVANNAKVSQTVVAPRLLDACVKFTLYYYSEATGAIDSTTVSLNSATNGL